MSVELVTPVVALRSARPRFVPPDPQIIATFGLRKVLLDQAGVIPNQRVLDLQSIYLATNSKLAMAGF